MKKISLIGSTGSIGRQVVEVVKRYPSRYKIVAMTAYGNRALFEKQVAEIKPEAYALASEDGETALGLAELANADLVFNAASGFAGLEYSLKAVKAGKTLALANKETLVCAGDLIIPLAKSTGAEIIPVDSEHSAIWQCLDFDAEKPVIRLIITASGGAFGDRRYETLKNVTPEEALAHPTWKMGRKITVDSATLMNKGYEVIEAHCLYKTPYSAIETVIQPQSIIHSLVEFEDGAVMAQMSYPTMEIPVQLALSYPDRLDSSVKPMDFRKAFSLGFKPLVRENYPCYDLALKCGESGGVFPCVMNAADEVAVQAFLEGRIAFTDIFKVVDGVVQTAQGGKIRNFAHLTEVDESARRVAQKIIDRL